MVVFYADGNKLSSFEHCPKYIADTLDISDNNFTSFKDIHKYIDHVSEIHTAYITSNILGLLLIQGLKVVALVDGDDEKTIEAFDIVNKHLIGGSRQSMIECQRELIEAGLEEYAKL
jgi:hypothetical protein